MFTGIIECVGEVISKEMIQGNMELKIRSAISNKLRIDQSVSHNGVCLTIVEQADDWHRVQVVSESLDKSNLGTLKTNERVNLERSLEFNGRLDGHLVQGHVDETTVCKEITEEEGSWTFKFGLSKENESLIIPKGSICINGVSLTIAQLGLDSFSVAVIPYTFEHTTFHTLNKGQTVNIEYDVLGKYVNRRIDLINRQ